MESLILIMAGLAVILSVVTLAAFALERIDRRQLEKFQRDRLERIESDLDRLERIESDLDRRKRPFRTSSRF